MKKYTVKRLGTFRVGSFGVYPPGNLRGDELMTLWAVEPAHSEHAKACQPALPSGKHLYPSRRAAREAAAKMK